MENVHSTETKLGDVIVENAHSTETKLGDVIVGNAHSTDNKSQGVCRKCSFYCETRDQVYDDFVANMDDSSLELTDGFRMDCV